MSPAKAYIHVEGQLIAFGCTLSHPCVISSARFETLLPLNVGIKDGVHYVLVINFLKIGFLSVYLMCVYMRMPWCNVEV